MWSFDQSPPCGAPRRLVARCPRSYDCGSAHGPHVDRMTFWRTLTHIGAHRPQTAPSCPVWHAHHPLPVICGPLQIAPITLHNGYWLKAPQLPAKSPHCAVHRLAIPKLTLFDIAQLIDIVALLGHQQCLHRANTLIVGSMLMSPNLPSLVRFFW